MYRLVNKSRCINSVRPSRRHKSAPALFLILVFGSLFVAGCQTPTGPRAVALLRAEKLQLEDNYAMLEAKYHMAMMELEARGHDTGSNNSNPSNGRLPTPATNSDDEDEFNLDDLDVPDIIIGNETDDPQGAQAIPQGEPQHFVLNDQAERQMAQYVSNIAIETDTNLADGLTIAIQPVDDDGAVIPIPGDIQVRVVDANAPDSESLAYWRYSRGQVASWVNDQPNSAPGIITTLPWSNGIPTGSDLRVDVLFRPANGETYEGSTSINKVGSGNLDGVVIEIGDVQDSGSEDPNRPKWSPDR